MKSLVRITCIFFTITLFSGFVFGQSGQYDIRIVKDTISCDSMYLYADIEVKAHNDTTLFNLADQNYRISFNRAAFRAYDVNLPEAQRSVQIVTELDVSGFVTEAGTSSFYGPHNLMGSVDTIISYNLELSGGEGYPLSDSDWTSVGRISFQIIDFNACADIWIHNNDPVNFPSTFISEKFANQLYPTDEGSYFAYEECLDIPCPQNEPPISNDDYINTLEGFPISYDILYNDIDNDNNLDASTMILLSTPPANEATVSMGPGAGYITVTPTGIWAGSVVPFDYQVCDDFGVCSSATVYVTIDDNPTTSTTQYNSGNSVKVFPTLVTETVTIAFDIQDRTPLKTIISMVDVQGRLVKNLTKEIHDKHSFQLTVNQLIAGTYFVKLQLGNEVITKKIIKQ